MPSIHHNLRVASGKPQLIGLSPVTPAVNVSTALDHLWPMAPAIVKRALDGTKLPGFIAQLKGGRRFFAADAAFQFCPSKDAALQRMLHATHTHLARMLYCSWRRFAAPPPCHFQ